MRLPLTLAALMIATGPAWADEKPSHDDLETMSIYSEATSAGAFCQDYRINDAQLSAFLNSRGFNSRNITERFPDTFKDMSESEVDAFKGDRKLLCQTYFDALGDFGTHPHILVHR